MNASACQPTQLGGQVAAVSVSKANQHPAPGQAITPKDAVLTHANQLIIKKDEKRLYKLQTSGTGDCSTYPSEWVYAQPPNWLTPNPGSYATLRNWFDHPEQISLPQYGKVTTGFGDPYQGGDTYFEIRIGVEGATSYTSLYQYWLMPNGDIEVDFHGYMFPGFPSGNIANNYGCIPGPEAPPLKLTADKRYFSPKNSSFYPTDTLTIATKDTAKKWVLDVYDSSGNYLDTLKKGTGSTTIEWNGKVKGTKLPDGLYSLRLSPLTPQPGETPSVVSVGVDTSPPLVSDIYVENISQNDDDTFNYTFAYKIDNASTDIAPSPIDTQSVQITKTNANVRSVGSATLGQDGYYRTDIQFALGDAGPLHVDLAVADTAGNTGDGKGDFTAKFTFTGFGVNTMPTCNPAQLYRTQAVDDGAASPWTNDDTPGWQIVTPGAVIQALLTTAIQGGILAGEKGIEIAQEATRTAVRRMCLGPATEDYNNPVKTPFYCPLDGSIFQYAVGLMFLNPATGAPVGRVPHSVVGVKLRAHVMFHAEELDNDAVWFSEPYVIKNTGEPDKPVTVVEWNGVGNVPLSPQLGQVAPSGHYQVIIDFDGRWSPSISPNQIWVPPGFQRLDPHESGLVGFRVINNLDQRPGFGPAAPPTGTKEDRTKQKRSAFQAFKRLVGEATTGPVPYEWHHIVEQNQEQFPLNQVNSTYNLIRIPRTAHSDMNLVYFTQPHPELTGQAIEDPTPLRNYMKNHNFSFTQQYDIGLKILANYGIKYGNQTD